jgi:hypothetical protein
VGEKIVVALEGMYGCALVLVLIVRVLVEAMTSVAELVAALVGLLLLWDMGRFDLGEVVTPGIGVGVLTTSC